jgi:hypothetical protein
MLVSLSRGKKINGTLHGKSGEDMGDCFRPYFNIGESIG